MPKTKTPRAQLTLGVMMLWIAVCAACCWNLKIVAIDQRENVEIIWREWFQP